MSLIKVKEAVTYGGHSISANGAVNLTLKAGYSELTSTIQLLQLLNNDVYIKAKVPGSKPVKLGSFRLKDVGIAGDGCSTIKFNGITDYVEVDNINMLPKKDSDVNIFLVLMEAEIEDEEDNEDGEDE